MFYGFNWMALVRRLEFCNTFCSLHTLYLWPHLLHLSPMDVNLYAQNQSSHFSLYPVNWAHNYRCSLWQGSNKLGFFPGSSKERVQKKCKLFPKGDPNIYIFKKSIHSEKRLQMDFYTIIGFGKFWEQQKKFWDTNISFWTFCQPIFI